MTRDCSGIDDVLSKKSKTSPTKKSRRRRLLAIGQLWTWLTCAMFIHPPFSSVTGRERCVPTINPLDFSTYF